MPSANELSSPVALLDVAAPTVASIARTRAEFARRMDLWGAWHRMVVAALTMAVTFSLVAQPMWLLSVAAFYLLLSTLVPTALDKAPSATAKERIRIAVMLVDVTVVSLFVFRWGARVSPAPFMYIPVVSGWTLIPQRHLGRLSGVTALCAYAALLGAESFGWSSYNEKLTAALESSSASGIIYFATFACALLAVHGLLDFTVQRLQEHSQVVSRLTAEKQTRERESQLVVQLEEAQRLEALGRLAGGVAHDFNNLLTVLMGCAELAEASLSKNHELAARSLRDLQKAAERGASLTAQLLDFASRRPASPRNVDLNMVVANAAKLLERLLEANVLLRVTLCPEPCMAHLDPSGMERLLLNLAVNARDAMPQGGVLSLTLSRRSGAGELERVVLEVNDTGVGIASGDLPHIFEPFFTTKARGKGTGLGLASVYGLVKQSQGQIEVESSPGVGTTFRISWPRVPDEAGIMRTEEPGPARGNERILLVDDDAEVRAVALAQLERGGYTVLTACSGQEALDLLAKNQTQVHMLVSDVSMPGMSGVELARAVRTMSPDLPILLISGYSEELHDGTQRIGRFLAKPFSGQRLLTEVRQALDGKTDRA